VNKASEILFPIHNSSFDIHIKGSRYK